MNVTTLDEETAQKDRIYSRLSRESILIMISGIGSGLALIAVILSALALDRSHDASNGIKYQDRYIEDLSGDIAVYRIRAAKLDAWLKAHGVPTEDIYDD